MILQNFRVLARRITQRPSFEEGSRMLHAYDASVLLGGITGLAVAAGWMVLNPVKSGDASMAGDMQAALQAIAIYAFPCTGCNGMKLAWYAFARRARNNVYTP